MKKVVWGIILIIFLIASSGYYFWCQKTQKEKAEKESKGYIPSVKIKRERPVYAPILLYHHIAKKTPQDSYYVSPEIFAKQMQWLYDNDFHVINYGDFYKGLFENGYLPPKPVIITFDDGVIDQYDNAFPILKKYHYPATFFIKINIVNKTGGLTYEMLDEMIGAGMEIGSHSYNHDNMKNMNSNQLDFELQTSKRILEENLQIPIRFFAYPGGTYSDLTIEQTKKAGYFSAATTRHDVYHIPDESPFTVPRIHIDDEMESFKNWIANIK